MVKICEPGQTGCPDCGGDRSHHGHGYGPWLFWPFKRRRLCKKCWGHGFIQFAPSPPLPPKRNDGIPEDARRVEKVYPEVVIIHSYRAGFGGHFAVVFVDGKEFSDIPLVKEQTQSDEFFRALREMIIKLVKEKKRDAVPDSDRGN